LNFLNKYFFFILLLVIVVLPYLLHPGLYQVGRDSGYLEDAIGGNLHRLFYYWNDYNGSGTLGVAKYGNIIYFSILQLLQFIFPSWAVQLLTKLFFYTIGFWGSYLLVKLFAQRFQWKIEILPLTLVAFFFCTNLIAFDLYKSWLYYYYIFYFTAPLLVYSLLRFQRNGSLKFLLLFCGLALLNSSSFSNISYFSIQILLGFILVVFYRGGNYRRALFCLLIFLLLNITSLFEIGLTLHYSLPSLLNNETQVSLISSYKDAQEQHFTLTHLFGFASGRLFGQQWSGSGLVNEFHFSQLYLSIPFQILLYIPIFILLYGLFEVNILLSILTLCFLISLLSIAIFGFSPFYNIFEYVFGQFPQLWVFRNSLKFSLIAIPLGSMLLYFSITSKKYLKYLFVFYLVVLNFYGFAGYFSNYYQFGSIPTDYSNLESNLSGISVNWDEKCIIYPASQVYHWYGFASGYTGFSPIILGLQSKIPCLVLDSKFENSSNAFLFNTFEDPSKTQFDSWQKYKVKYIFLHKDVIYWVFNQPLITTQTESYLNGIGFKKVLETDSYILYQTYEDQPATNNPFINKINPTYYRVSVANLATSSEFVFNQSFSSGWGLYLEKYSSTCTETKQTLLGFSNIRYLFRTQLVSESHHLANSYANGWELDPDEIKALYSSDYYYRNLDGGMNICVSAYFKPQSFFYIGILVTLITILALLTVVGLNCLPTLKKRILDR